MVFKNAIVLTGGIATGKSTVANIFKEYCVVFRDLCPSILLPVSIGTPLERVTVVAKVWRTR